MLRKIVELIHALLISPSSIAVIRHDQNAWKSKFRRKYGHTDHLPVAGIDQFVPADCALDKFLFLGGGSSIPDLLLLQALSRRSDVLAYFEIGTWRGESLTAVAPHVRRAYSLDMDVESMRKDGISSNTQQQMGTLTGHLSNVQYLKSDSLHFNFASVPERCDLIFIDGGHDYRHVLSDTRNVLKYLTHDRSIIVWHDYGMDPELIRWQVYKAIMDGIPKSNHDRLFHVSNTKCAMLWPVGDIDSRQEDFPQYIKHEWSVLIKRN